MYAVDLYLRLNERFFDEDIINTCLKAILEGNNEPEASSEFSHLQRPLPFSSRISMTEPPFVPRERVLKYQQYFQNIHKHTYLKGRYDMITSVAIPIALTASSLYLIGRGIYNMSYGIGKKE